MSPQLGSIFFFFFLIMFSDRRSATAQRPSYAGSRPPSGLSQKHKYQAQYMSNNNNTNDNNNNNNNNNRNSSILNLTTPDNGIVNRFGGAIDSRIDSNVTQRPPVGMPVVLPESVYVPLPTVAAAATPAVAPQQQPQQQQQQPTRPQTLPIDAHGDADLVNRLSLLPEDQRPFWFLNYLAIEAQRNGTGANVASSSISQSSFLG